MDKILVEVFLPAANKSFEIYIPLEMKLHEVTFLVAKSLSELANGLFVYSDDSILCERGTGMILDVNKTAKELQFKNGSKLMLL